MWPTSLVQPIPDDHDREACGTRAFILPLQIVFRAVSELTPSNDRCRHYQTDAASRKIKSNKTDPRGGAWIMIYRLIVEAI